MADEEHRERFPEHPSGDGGRLPLPPPAPRRESFPSFLRANWSPITGLFGLLVMIGVSYAALNSTVAATTALQLEQREMRSRLDRYEQRLTDADRRTNDLETRQRDMDRELRGTLDTIKLNIAALCVATRGAQCK